MSSNYNEIARLLSDDSFIAWIEGRATLREAQEWEAWTEADFERKALVEEARQLHNGLQFDTPSRPEVDFELSRLNDKIDDQSEKRESNISPISYFTLKPSYFSAAAALLLLIMVSATAYFLVPLLRNKKQQEPQFKIERTLNGQQKKLTLSDGSVIDLNANSSLKYPAHYTGGDLDVWLKGEAYFDIVHKTGAQERFFSVHIPDGEVNVLGTKFNVNTYEKASEVVLVRGKVWVAMKNHSASVKDSYIMHPGERSLLSLKNGIVTSKVDTTLYTAWTRDKLVFDHMPLAEVAQRIEHIYGVQFQLNGYNLKDIVISGSLPNNNMQVFLNTLQKLINHKIIRKGNRLILENSAKK